MTGHPIPARLALCSMLLLAAAHAAARAAVEPPLVPRPAQLELGAGTFALRAAHALALDPDDAAMRDIAGLLAERVARTCGRTLAMDDDGSAPAAIVLRRRGRVDAASTQAYRLEVQPRRLRIDAATDDGLRQGATTALQLLCTPGASAVPALRIDDAPALAWRGAMLDSAR